MPAIWAGVSVLLTAGSGTVTRAPFGLFMSASGLVALSAAVTQV